MENITRRIMVVDDDESIRESLRKLLAGEGYQVIASANGTEAVETFRHSPEAVDLLLVDLNMPRKNGWVTLNQLLEIKPSLPIFIVTGIPYQSELAAAAGVRVLVEKPIDVPELLSVIKRQLAVPPFTGEKQPRETDYIFHHIRAKRHLQHSREAELQITPHHHWGLNE